MFHDCTFQKRPKKKIFYNVTIFDDDDDDDDEMMMMMMMKNMKILIFLCYNKSMRVSLSFYWTGATPKILID